jgi:Undecaprenyl-phosphate glucose phosphotransferase
MNNNFEQAVNPDQDQLVAAAHPADKASVPNSLPDIDQSRKYRLPTLMNALKLADMLALLAAGVGGYLLRFGLDSASPTGHLLIYLNTLVTVVALHLAHAYRLRSINSLYALINSMFVGGATALLLMLACGYLSGTLHDYSRVWLVCSVLLSAALLLLNRVAITQIVQRAGRAERLTETVVVVGANERAEKMIDAIGRTSNANVKVLGVFDDRLQREPPASLLPHLLGSTDVMLNYIRQNRVDRVVVTLPWVGTDRILALLKKLSTVPVRIDLVPSDVVWNFPSINMERLGSVPVLTIANGRVDEQIGVVKRIEDLLISSLVLLLISPILLLVAVAIKLDSKGPVIFKQRRHGFNNEVFEVYKFRSMTVSDSAKATVVQATRNDMRVTRIGKFLRRTSIDELPQLFNVLFGHMSIVGPRPHAVQHNIEYGAIIDEYYARHNVKPGITGWAQVSGLRGETDTLEKMARRVEFDIHYIEHWSLGLDIKIILMTAIAVWFDPNAY